MANWYVCCFDKSLTNARREIDGRKVVRVYEIKTPNSHADAETLADRMESKYRNCGLSHIRTRASKPYYSPKKVYVYFEEINNINSVWNFRK